MKKTVIALLTKLGSLLPDRLWHLLLKVFLHNDRLVAYYGMFYISELASRLNIVRFSAVGEYGVFTSESNDAMILRRYATTGQWAVGTNDMICKFFAEGHGTYLDIGAISE